MSFQLSPGVRVREIDLTTVIPAVATTDAVTDVQQPITLKLFSQQQVF